MGGTGWPHDQLFAGTNPTNHLPANAFSKLGAIPGFVCPNEPMAAREVELVALRRTAPHVSSFTNTAPGDASRFYRFRLQPWATQWL
jgi:hypothetical protein